MAERTKIRNLILGEKLPQLSPDDSPVGVDLLELDPEWVWIAEQRGEPVGFLVGGNLHGLLVLMRIIVSPESDCPTIPLLLLRRALRVAKQRGCVGWITILSDESVAEVKLMRIAMRHNDLLIPHRGVWAMGRL